MPYTPTVWKTGDIVSSEKLNKLERGVADATSEEIIDSWLEENISQETGYVLDRTLSMSNAAAPADLVGDQSEKVEEIEESLGYNIDLDEYNYSYNRRVVTGGIGENPSGTRIRIVFKLDYPFSFEAKCTGGKGIAVSLYSTLENAFLANTSYTQTFTNNSYTTNTVSGATSNTGYLTFSLCKNDGSVISDEEWLELFEATSISITETTTNPTVINDLNNTVSGNASTEDGNADMLDAIVSCSGYNTYKSGDYSSAIGEKKNISFAAITDLHGSKDAFDRFLKFCNKRKQYLDFGVGLGDFVPVQPSNSTYWIGELLGKSEIPFFYTVGNHDVADTGLSGITQASARTKYFSKIETKQWIESTEFEGIGKCSWAKDFEDYNIRIISLYEYGNSSAISTNAPASYCRRWVDTDTLQWFANTLYSTPQGYSVMVFLHQIPYAPMDFVSNDFTITESSSYVASHWSSIFLNTIDGNPIEEIVNAFKTSANISKTYSSIASYSLGKTATVSKDFSERSENGQFIAYFVGHTHGSYVFKSQTYADQFCIVVPTGSENIFQRNYGDMLYDGETRNKDNFYVIGVDTDAKKINIAQIGGQVTTDMRKRVLTSISYA